MTYSTLHYSQLCTNDSLLPTSEHACNSGKPSCSCKYHTIHPLEKNTHIGYDFLPMESKFMDLELVLSLGLYGIAQGLEYADLSP